MLCSRRWKVKKVSRTLCQQFRKYSNAEYFDHSDDTLVSKALLGHYHLKHYFDHFQFVPMPSLD